MEEQVKSVRGQCAEQPGCEHEVADGALAELGGGRPVWESK